MYVRWKVNRRRARWVWRAGMPVTYNGPDGPVTYVFETRGEVRQHTAQLVESARVDGKVRQHVILHIGTIPEHLMICSEARVMFWAWANTKLDWLHLPGGERETMLARLAEHIGPLSAAELDSYNEVRERIVAAGGIQVYHQTKKLVHTPRGFIQTRGPILISGRRDKRHALDDKMRLHRGEPPLTAEELQERERQDAEAERKANAAIEALWASLRKSLPPNEHRA